MVVQWDESYSAALRAYIEQMGKPVLFTDPECEFPEFRVSTYGWQDYDADEHIRATKCGWTLPKGAAVEELTYSQFTDTDADNLHSVGINASPAHCRCGMYVGVTLRVESSLSNAIKFVCNFDPKHITL